MACREIKAIRVYLQNVDSGRRRKLLGDFPGSGLMPRFSPNGTRKVVLSMSQPSGHTK